MAVLLGNKYTRFEANHRSNCVDCGADIYRRSTRCHACENKLRASNYLGENNPSWKGGRTNHEGYVYIRVNGGGHPYKAEHTVVWEQVNGELPKGWIIHHLNGIRDDNRLENLCAMPRERHSPQLAFEPYEKRIQELEDELRKLK